jgi:uncharacterized protein YndB with AHSA1/START domain
MFPVRAFTQTPDGGAMAASDSFQTCPTEVIHASPERVWELLVNPDRLGWLGVKVVQAPARNLAVGDRLVFGPAPGLRLSWDVLAVEPPRALELDVKVPFGIRNHEIVVVSPLGSGSCRVTFT